MKSDHKKTIAIRIDKDLIAWFEEGFKMRGAKQWFFESCIQELKKLHDSGEYIIPEDLVSMSVPEVVKDLGLVE